MHYRKKPAINMTTRQDKPQTKQQKHYLRSVKIVSIKEIPTKLNYYKKQI